MKRKPRPNVPKDTPAIRKQRLQQRLQELNDKSDREMDALMKSVEKVKSAYRPESPKAKP